MPGSTLTEDERARAITTAKAITSEHLDAVLDILATERAIGDDRSTFAFIRPRREVNEAPIIEFVAKTYEIEFANAARRLLSQRR